MTQDLKLRRKWTFRAHGKQMVFIKWNKNLEPFRRILKKETGSIRRAAPVDLISFPAESNERFIRRDGTIQIAFEDINRIIL